MFDGGCVVGLDVIVFIVVVLFDAEGKRTYLEDRSVYLYHPCSPQEDFTRPNLHCLPDVHEAQRVMLQ
jgi:hypothetical protein